MTAPSRGTDDPPHWRRNARTIAIGNVLINLGWSSAFAFLPLIVKNMGVVENLELFVGLMMFGYYGVSCVFTPIWGVLADHYGRKSMVLRAGFGMAAGFTLLALISDPIVFALALVATGLVNGFVPAGQALVATGTPSREIGRALALTQAGAHTGNLIGPVVGAALIGTLHKAHSLFAFTGLAMFAAAFLVLYVVRERHERPTQPLRIDLRGDIARLAQVHDLKLLYFLQALFAFTVYGAIANVTLFTLELLGPRTSHAGISVEAWVAMMAIGFTITSIVALPFWGWMLDRRRPARVLSIILVGSLVTAVLQPLATDPLQLFVARMIFALFVAGLLPTIIRMTRDRSPRGMEARTLSYGTAIQQVGAATAPLVAGLLAPYLGLRGFFAVAAVLMGVGWMLWRKVELRTRSAA